MKKPLIGILVVLMFVMALSVVAKSPSGKGFDEFGYNKQARNFVGTCLSWHMGKFSSTEDQATAYCGDYSNDKLKMKWNAEWDRGNAEGWSDPNGYDAWEDNQWNGMFPGGSGETWHYKIKWIGPCGAYGTPTTNGGYCIWGQFEVTMSHGTFEGQHFWDAHATPSGYGS